MFFHRLLTFLLLGLLAITIQSAKACTSLVVTDLPPKYVPPSVLQFSCCYGYLGV